MAISVESYSFEDTQKYFNLNTLNIQKYKYDICRTDDMYIEEKQAITKIIEEYLFHFHS